MKSAYELAMEKLQDEAPVPKLTRTPGKIRWTGKPMGTDNYDVFHRILGLSEKEIHELSTNGII